MFSCSLLLDKENTEQPKLANAPSQATLCGSTQTHIVDDRGDRANVQQGVCQNTGGRKLSSAFCNSIVLHIQLDVILFTFLLLSSSSVFQSSSVPGGRNTNSRTSASPVRWASFCRHTIIDKWNFTY